MKSRRRHELQQNVLDAELGKVVGFFKKRGSWIAWGVLIAALIVFLVVYVRGRGRREIEKLQARYDQLMSVQFRPGVDIAEILAGFKALVDQDDDERIAALACVRVANMYAASSRSASQRTGSEWLTFVAQAEKYYHRAIENFPDERLAVAEAHLGLAKLAESRTPPNLNAARNQYQAIIKVPQLAGYPVMREAQRSLAALDALGEPIPMATTTQAATSRAATAPTTTQAATSRTATAPAESSPAEAGTNGK